MTALQSGFWEKSHEDTLCLDVSAPRAMGMTTTGRMRARLAIPGRGQRNPRPGVAGWVQRSGNRAPWVAVFPHVGPGLVEQR